MNSNIWSSIRILAGVDQELHFPSGICMDLLHGKLYFSELHNASVYCVNTHDGAIEKLSAKAYSHGEETSIEKPLGISYGTQYGLVLTDVSKDRIYMWNEQETIWMDISDTRQLHKEKYHMLGGITGDVDKNIYVNDFLNQRICKITVSGETETVVVYGQTSYKRAKGISSTVGRCYGIFCYKEFLYLTDTDNSKILKMNLSNNEIVELPLADGICKRPIAVTVDNAGNILFCEQRRVVGVSSSGERVLFCLDTSEWKKYAKEFGIPYRLGNSGAIVSGEAGIIYLLDPIRGKLYEMVHNEVIE